jgi:hypothetical protein
MKFAPDVTYVQQLQRSKAFGLLSIKLIQIKLQSYILSEDLVILVFMGILLLRNLNHCHCHWETGNSLLSLKIRWCKHAVQEMNVT